MPTAEAQSAPIAVVWEFTARPELTEEFIHRYGPTGDWAHLFAKSRGYLGTELLHDAFEPRRYLTVDRWLTHADYAEFKQQHAREYSELDQQCEHLCLAEQHVGTFTASAPGTNAA